MKILSIETSCDDTSIAVLSVQGKKIEALSNVVSSQIKLHSKWGGVVPQLASREHAKNIDWVLKAALKESDTKISEIDLVTVTSGPGLIVSLVIGTTFAKSLAWKHDLPLLGINHIEGHVYSNWLGKIPTDKNLFPALCLIVSGGHTQIVLMTKHGKYKMIGETVDDASGEAFDKIARILGLGYPGGPLISKYAELGNAERFALPRPMIRSKNYDFSFSGLKTAVLYLTRDLIAQHGKLSKQLKYDLAASAQKAIVDVLVAKTMRAAEEYKVKSVMLSGGVSANKLLREELVKAGNQQKIQVIIPEMKYTTDNAAMIGIAGYYNWLRISKSSDFDTPSSSLSRKKNATDSWRDVQPSANWEIV